jgi:shikimate dehydrogenase
MTNIYTNSKKKIFAVIGNPIAHSLSPCMHNAAFKHLKLPFVFAAFKVENLASGILGIKSLDISGISVTIPHKIEIIKHINKIDKKAKAIGSVNTVLNKNGILSGYNTDCDGAMKALLEKTLIKGKHAAVIGAGGAARAIVFGLISSGANVTIINRSIKKGENLAYEFGAEFSPFSDIKKRKYDIIINTTPLGMFPNVDATPFDKKYFEKDMVVMDIVYSPLKTKFLKDAENAGCTIINGLSMFVFQGALQFELFTNKKAPIEIMKKVVFTI